MDEKQSQALANEPAKNLKTPDDISQFERLLKKSVPGRRSTPRCPTIWAAIKISPDRRPTPATAIPQRQ
ncbi:transposase [Erwinia tracheiphila PSU-1]|nr:transposase [Erwinia tracheiphila PSU-1]